MRSEKLHREIVFFAFRGACLSFCFDLGHEIVHVGQEKHVPHDREIMVGIHGEIIENERENLITSSRELMEVFALVLHDFPMDSHHSSLWWGISR